MPFDLFEAIRPEWLSKAAFTLDKYAREHAREHARVHARVHAHAREHARVHTDAAARNIVEKTWAVNQTNICKWK